MNPDRSLALVTRLRAEQVAALFQNVTLGVIGAATAAVVLAGAVFEGATPFTVMGPLLVFAAAFAALP